MKRFNFLDLHLLYEMMHVCHKVLNKHENLDLVQMQRTIPHRPEEILEKHSVHVLLRLEAIEAEDRVFSEKNAMVAGHWLVYSFWKQLKSALGSAMAPDQRACDQVPIFKGTYRPNGSCSRRVMRSPLEL